MEGERFRRLHERHQKIVETHLEQSERLLEDVKSFLLMYDEREKLRQNPTPSSAHPKPTTTKPTKRTPAQKFYPPWFQPKPTKSTPTKNFYPPLNQVESTKTAPTQPFQNVEDFAAFPLEEVSFGVEEGVEEEKVPTKPCTLSIVEDVQSVAREEEVTKSDLGIVVAQLVEPSFNEVHNNIEEQEEEVPEQPCTLGGDEARALVCNVRSVTGRNERVEDLRVPTTLTQNPLFEYEQSQAYENPLFEYATHLTIQKDEGKFLSEQVHSRERALITCCHIEASKDKHEQVWMGCDEKRHAFPTYYRDYIDILKLRPPLEVLVEKNFVLSSCNYQTCLSPWQRGVWRLCVGDVAHALRPRVLGKEFVLFLCYHYFHVKQCGSILASTFVIKDSNFMFELPWNVGVCFLVLVMLKVHQSLRRLQKDRWSLSKLSAHGADSWNNTLVPTVLIEFDKGDVFREDEKQQTTHHSTKSIVHACNLCEIKTKLEICNHVHYNVTLLVFYFSGAQGRNVKKWFIGYLVWIFMMKMPYENLQQMDALFEHLQQLVMHFYILRNEELRSILFREGGNDVIMENPIPKVPKLIDKLMKLDNPFVPSHANNKIPPFGSLILRPRKTKIQIILGPFSNSTCVYFLCKFRYYQAAYSSIVHVFAHQPISKDHASPKQQNPRSILQQFLRGELLVQIHISTQDCSLIHSPHFSPLLLSPRKVQMFKPQHPSRVGFLANQKVHEMLIQVGAHLLSNFRS